MKIDITKKIEIPEGITLNIEKDMINVKGPKGENSRKIFHPRVSITKKDNDLILESKKASKREKKTLNTLRSHIRNLIKGVEEGYEYKLKICSGHFPMNVSVKDKEVIVKNFFGEKIPRKAKIIENVNVKIEGEIINVSGVDKENVSQTASNIELSTRRTKFDKRIFQDGIWITKKAK